MWTRVLLLTTATALLAVAPLSSATAATTHDVLTTDHVGGQNVTVGDTIKSHLPSGTTATFYAPGTTDGVSCAAFRTISTVTANPTAPGTAGESVSQQFVKKCTSNIPEVTVLNVTVLGLPYAVTISDASGDPVTIANASTEITLKTPIGKIQCTYGDPSVDGNASNTGQTITFTNQEFTLTSGPSACAPAGDFSATLGPNRDSTAGNDRVFVN
jgi:hypothetical protein